MSDYTPQPAVDEWFAEQERRAEEHVLREEADDEGIFIVTGRWKVDAADDVDIDRFEGVLEPMSRIVMTRFPDGSDLLSQQLIVRPAGPGKKP